MKVVGIMLMIAGVGWIVFAFNMQMDQSDVYNIGLVELRRNHMELGALTVLVGALFFGFGSIVEKLTSDEERQKGTKACPHCYERIPVEAEVCQHCLKTVADASSATTADSEGPKEPMVGVESGKAIGALDEYMRTHRIDVGS